MPSRYLRPYVAAVSLLALAGLSALATISDDPLDRAWLIAAFAAVIAAEHLFETRIVWKGAEGESTFHEESFLVAMALLAPPLAVGLAFAAGFLAGGLISRRGPLKILFNASTMVLGAAVALLVMEALGGARADTPRAALAVVAGAAAYVVVNRIAVSGVLALAGAGSFRRGLFDDPGARALVAAGDVSLGLLAGLAAQVHLWTLPFALAALLALHFTLSGDVRARAQQQRLAELVASTSDGIVSLDRNERVTSWNPASKEITGYAASRVLGAPLAEVYALLHAEEAEAADEREADLYEEGERRPQVLRIRAEDGATRWLTVSRAPLPEGGDVLVLRDDTTRRQIDELRAQEERELLRSGLVANVSHELRTPLTSILGFTQTLLRHETDDETRRRYLSIVEQEGERLRHLIDVLLDLRSGEEGRFTVARERLDLADVVDEEVELAAAQAPAHALRKELDGRPLWVDGDARRLRQVVSNLLSNAVKYSPGGGDVTIAAARVDGRVRVSVTDSGLGIPAAQQQQIFTRFFRVETPERREIGGSGLGLALTREIVEAHGGRIGFESAEGRGSTFFFELPEAAAT